MSFSNFNSLLEVAFALNVSYHLIPNLHNVGKKKIDEIELEKITEWQAKIEEAGTNDEKNKYKIFIETIKSSSDENTSWKSISQILNTYVATTFSIVTLIILFLSAAEVKFLDALPLGWKIFVIALLLSPNVVSIFFQVLHWHKIKEQLKNLVNKLEKK